MANKYTTTTELAVVRYARAMYDAMLAKATIENLEGRELPVYRGAYGKLFDSLKISRSYYGPIRNLLESSGCIEYIQRAANGRSGIVALVRPLADSDLDGFGRKDLTKPTEGAMLQAVARLEDDLKRLRARFDTVTKGLNIVDALKNHEDRLIALENQTTGRGNGKQAKGKAAKPQGK